MSAEPTPAPTPTPDPAPPPTAQPPAPPAPPPQAPPQMAPPALPVPAPTPTPPAPTPTPTEQLGEAGIRALHAERQARAAAEKEAKDERARGTAAVEQLRSARLELALANKGLAGPKALAASKLLEGVEYNDAGEPTNLDARLEAATATYGAEQFAGATPAPTPAPAPATPAHPDLHAGPRATPDPDENEKVDAYMRANFPGQIPAPSNNR